MSDPIREFRELFQRAGESEADASACALATAGAADGPSVRMVLLKAVDERGFVFYTNYGSRKARQVEETRRAALCFHWPTIDKQVRVEGTVERVSEAESDAYFTGRPRGSRLGAWASHQSRPLQSRWRLLRDYASLKLRYAGREIPRPEFWGGYRIAPERIEFWSGERYRLHDRRLFLRADGDWTMERLYP